VRCPKVAADGGLLIAVAGWKERKISHISGTTKTALTSEPTSR